MKTKEVKDWLSQSQRNIPYELDFYTPFKDMAPPVHKALPRESDLKQLSGALSEHFRSAEGANGLCSIDSQPEESESDSSGKYKRQKRQRVRDDHYEYKGNNRRRKGRQHWLHEREKRRNTRWPALKRLPICPNGSRDPGATSKRLTLRSQRGIFENGRASKPVRRRGLPDLLFPDETLNNLSRIWAQQDCRNGGYTDRAVNKRDFRQQKVFSEDEIEMSRFFQTAPDYKRPRAYKNRNATTGQNGSIYQTPCRPQRHQHDDRSVEFELEFPGKPYLGFGKPGPLSEVPMPQQGKTDNGHKMQVKRGKHVGEKLSPTFFNNVMIKDPLSSSHHTEKQASVDPRAAFSPLSNFRFARKQLDVPCQQKDSPMKQGQPDVERQRRISHLIDLIRLEQQQQMESNRTVSAEPKIDVDSPRAKHDGSGSGQSADTIDVDLEPTERGECKRHVDSGFLNGLDRLVDERITRRLGEVREGKGRLPDSTDNGESADRLPKDEKGNGFILEGAPTPLSQPDGKNHCYQQIQTSPPSSGTDQIGMQASELARGVDAHEDHQAEEGYGQKDLSHNAGEDCQARMNGNTPSPAQGPVAEDGLSALDFLPSVGFVKPHSRLQSQRDTIRMTYPPLGPSFYLGQLHSASGSTHSHCASSSAFKPSDRPFSSPLRYHWHDFRTAPCTTDIPPLITTGQSRPFSSTVTNASAAFGRPFSQATWLSSDTHHDNLIIRRALPCFGLRPVSAVGREAEALAMAETQHHFDGFWKPNTLY